MDPLLDFYEGWDYRCKCGVAMRIAASKQWVCDSCGFVWMDGGVSFEEAYKGWRSCDNVP